MAEPDTDHTLSDVCKPGDPRTKTKALQLNEALGSAPLIWNPMFNRGTSWQTHERQNKGLEGLVPPAIETIEQQAERVMLQLHEECSTALNKYELLADLSAQNITLFYWVLVHNFKELAPVVYTPTVGEACQKFDRIFRAAQGMYLDAFNHRGRFRKVLDNWFSHTVQIIVVTDGGRILGLGDLGTNGMGIPVGKINLYVAGAGFHPEHSLPITLDCGTDNEDLLKDKFYLGNKQKRIRDSEEHMAIVDELCSAVVEKWPGALIQFEDFQTDKAFAILDRWRDRCLCFNDDIQGTGATVVTGVINGVKAQKLPLKDVRVVFYGMGSSAVGVAKQIATLLQKDGGLSEKEAYERLYGTDSKGLVTTSRGDKLPAHKLLVARRDDTPNMKTLAEVVQHVKPNVLIGLAGAGPAFEQDLVEELCKHHERPMLFPLSNPTSQAEITAEDAYKWSKGKCIFASGSPFDPVEVNGKTITPGQANNVLIFPGLGFGAVIVKAKSVKDEMLLAASRALADYVSEDAINDGLVYPDLGDLREISAHVATAVAEEAFNLGIAGIEQPKQPLLEYVRGHMWHPDWSLQSARL